MLLLLSLRICNYISFIIFSICRRGGGDSLRRSRMDDFGWGNANKGGSWDIDTFEQSSSLSEPIAPKSDDRLGHAF